MHGLIDTTEMYLRTIFELEEEGIVPLRARIAERLSQSGPTVSQTVARMERDGLVKVEGDRQLALTPAGARELVGKGHEVLVETGAGEGSAMSDAEVSNSPYARAPSRPSCTLSTTSTLRRR